MPKIVTKRGLKARPEGYDEIEPVLVDYENQKRDVERADPTLNKKGSGEKALLRLNYAKTRYVYDMYYKRQMITKALYTYLLESKEVDAALIAKWKKTGYEKLCCVKCIQRANADTGAVCICRVPNLSTRIECAHCGMSHWNVAYRLSGLFKRVVAE